MQAAVDPRNPPPLDWYKGHGASSRAFYKIGTYPAILDVVAALLGEDVILWGASIVSRPPDAVHAWHTDIESSHPSGETVSVWIGIEGTSRDSSLSIIPYSHRFGVSVQEAEFRLGQTTNEDIVRWARERDRRSQLVWLEMIDGEALFFDGRLWHGSHNTSRKTRRALLLQYATPRTVIRIPDPNHLQWPFRQLNLPRPPCLMVRGNDGASVNRVVAAPMAPSGGSDPQLTSRVYALRIPAPGQGDKGWKPYPIFHGSTADLRSLSCHASVLTRGECPHPPHAHREEELLLLLAGEVDLILADEQGHGERRRRLRSGEFVYYPARFVHTLETVSDEPATYLMLKWFTDKTQPDSPLPFGQFTAVDTPSSPSREGLRTRQVFSGPTAYLRKLHCHASTLEPGAGYEAHIDAYDVAVLVLEGEVATLGEWVARHNVIFYAAGEPHGMRNVGGAIATYLVFEFHGSRAALEDAHLDPPPSLLARLADPRRWRRRLTSLLRRLMNR